MSLKVDSALEDGFKQLIGKNGLIFVILFFGASVMNTVFGGSLVDSIARKGIVLSGVAGEVPLAIEMSIPLAGFLVLFGLVLNAVVTVAALRTFVSGRETITTEFFTRNMLMASLNLLIGGIAFSIATAIGLIALIIPGIIIFVSLYFWNIFVTVEDQNFIQGFKNSWSLTKGERINVFALGLIAIILVPMMAEVVAGPLETLIRNQAGKEPGIIFGNFPSALISVFIMATTAQAYNQLKE